MPVQKEKKYEITFKNLRRREIPCLVIAVPQKNSEAQSDSGTCNSQNKNRSKILKCLKQRLNRLSTTPNKKSKSLSCLDRKSEMTPKDTKKRVYRKKSLEIENSPQKKTTSDVLNSSTLGIKNSPQKKTTSDVLNSSTLGIKNAPQKKTTSDVLNSSTLGIKNAPQKKTTSDVLNSSTLGIIKNIPVASAETSMKRTYRKKVQVCATITPITGSPISASTVETFFGSPVITPETPKKRVYRRKLKIPAVPHNTPVLGQASDGDSICNTSFLNHSEVITIGKRGRGRPRLSMPAIGVGSDNGEESTMSLGSDKGSVTKRARRSLWALDSEGEGEAEDQVSEYELLRQRNIEENLKMLREIFTEQGLQFEEKTSDTPKKRKSYSRVPLPPPRPRSQRIEIRRTFMPLDFSKLDEKLTMSEAAFM